MAILKCKMCGGDLNVDGSASVCTCDYCGTQQTVPKADDEKKIKLFDRANRLRMSCEFDKAYSVYETIVDEFDSEAEAYWGLVLCKYGIEYVDDPKTGKKIPTCHRSSFESVLDDPNLDLALENADVIAKGMYREEAKVIDGLRKRIIELSSKEEPYDVFICYKETGFDGNRTIDSVIAQDVYDALTEKGYKVFFSRITLEDKLGQEYEPYIFSALHSAKVMLAFGTCYEHYDAVWVKNEWSRFLKQMENGEKKSLIPCYKGMDPYDMPKEFAKLQAQDMGKVGAIQDLLRGIEKIIGKKKDERAVANDKANDLSTFAAPLIERAFDFIEGKEYTKANDFIEKALDYDPKNGKALLGKLFVEQKCSGFGELAKKGLGFTTKITYTKLLSCCDSDTKAKLEKAVEDSLAYMLEVADGKLKNKQWLDAKSKYEELLTYDKNNVECLLGRFLAEVRASDATELERSTVIIEKLPSYLALIAACDEETKAELKEAANKTRENNLIFAEQCLKARNWEKAVAYAKIILELEPNNERALLAIFLAEVKATSISDLQTRKTVLEKSPAYEKLISVCSEELKNSLAGAQNASKDGILALANGALNDKNWADAKKYSGELLKEKPNDEQLLLISFLADVKCVDFDELSALHERFDGLKSYEALTASCSEETKEKLNKCLFDVEKKIDFDNREKIKAKKKKKLIILCSSCAAVVLAAILIVALAVIPNTAKYIYGFKKVDGGYAITEYRGDESKLVIPNEYKGKPVVQISEGAFDSSDVTEITIPNSVTYVGKDAFKDCAKLKNVVLPFVGEKADGTGNNTMAWAFDTKTLKSIKTISVSGGKIADDAFKGCKSVASLTIPYLDGALEDVFGTIAPDSLKTLVIVGGERLRRDALYSHVIENLTVGSKIIETGAIRSPYNPGWLDGGADYYGFSRITFTETVEEIQADAIRSSGYSNNGTIGAILISASTERVGSKVTDAITTYYITPGNKEAPGPSWADDWNGVTLWSWDSPDVESTNEYRIGTPENSYHGGGGGAIQGREEIENEVDTPGGY